MTLRHRIKRHARIRAGDLIPHELNPRLHPEAQRAALSALYDEIGFARSLLAFELPDGKLKLIDGHLRAEMHPDEELEVEILDVSEEEARILLLAIDPLAELANYQAASLSQLRALVEETSPAVQQLWANHETAAEQTTQSLNEARADANQSLSESYLVLIECEDEAEQTALLERFQHEGLNCKALVS